MFLRSYSIPDCLPFYPIAAVGNKSGNHRNEQSQAKQGSLNKNGVAKPPPQFYFCMKILLEPQSDGFANPTTNCSS
jgi:hypothetical protein